MAEAIGFHDYKYKEDEKYVFDCPTCRREYVIDNDYDDEIVSTYGECPDCVAMYNAGI